MKKNKTILLFEPWYFGDLVIAAGIARSLEKHGYNIAIVYDQKWDEWIRGHSFINQFLAVKIPWTERRFWKKYFPGNYGYSFWRKVFSMKKVKPDIIIDVRGDIRHKILLRLIFPFKKIISLPHEDKINVYQKSLALLKKLNIQVRDETGNKISSINGDKPYVILFFGANDPNREVPTEKISDFILSVKDLDIRMSLVLKPGENTGSWKKLFEDLKPARFDFLQGSLSNISSEIQAADILISTDTGWLHVAKFYGKEIIGLYAFDTISRWAPPGIKVIKAPEAPDPKYKYRESKQHLKPLADLDIQILKAALIETLDELKANAKNK